MTDDEPAGFVFVNNAWGTFYGGLCVPHLYEIPKGTEESKCVRCGAPIYWTEQKRYSKEDRRPGTMRLPIDTSPAFCKEPDSFSSGSGVNHLLVCISEDA